MTATRVHPMHARRLAILAQGAAVALLACGVAAYVLLPVPSTVPTPPPKSRPAASADGPTEPQAEFKVISASLEPWDAPVPKKDEAARQGPATGRFAESWTYLGSIAEPNRRLAIVSVEGVQHLLAPGAELDGITVQEVRADQMVVAQQSQSRTIPRQEAKGAILGSLLSERQFNTHEGDDGFNPSAVRPMDRRNPGARPGAPATRTPPRPRPTAGPNSLPPRPTPEGS